MYSVMNTLYKKSMGTVCSKDMCSGCCGCIDVCPVNALVFKETYEACSVEKIQSRCIECGLCEKVCANHSAPELKKPIYYCQGWAEDDIRKRSSSGGAATAIMKSFIESGGYVASCLFSNGEFTFAVTDDFSIAKRFAGSKYVKSNPIGIYKKVQELLRQRKKILFIGLPCQSAAVQKICGQHENLYTVDLICHGTPAHILLKKFIEEAGIDWDSISDIQFRDGVHWGLSQDGKRIAPKRVLDGYTLAFLNGVDYMEGCYSCKYATLSRVSDVTLGDAWGQLSEIEPDGVSLILCQTDKGIDLVNRAKLHLQKVDLEKAVQDNQQLAHPSEKHSSRTKFFKAVNGGDSVKMAARMALPKLTIKQDIKRVLISMHIMKSRGGTR